jgi:ATP-dependent DNA helicase RecG
LFSKHPQDVFPQASLRITKFLSDERGTGANLNIDATNDYRMDGNIPTLIRKATHIIDNAITKRKALGADGEFIFQDIIPRDAWLEGVVNALIHRSYSLSGDYIHVELYPTRVEITSPGVFPGLAKIDDLLNISRFARNPRIARVCTEFRFGQELGEGIKRIVEQMRSFGYIDPIYTQNSGNVKLRLEAVMRLNDSLVRELPNKSEAVLNIIRLHKNGIGTGEIMEQLGMTRPTASLRLKKLEEKGLVEHIGKSNTDPRAVWTIAEKRSN